MNLAELRCDRTAWRVAMLAGPNVRADLAAVPDFERQSRGWAEALGVEVDLVQSSHEGTLLEYVHRTSEGTHGYLVIPGGLTTVGESLRHCLKDTRRPAVEVHWRNEELTGGSIFAPTVTSICSGLGHLSVLGALVALVLALDDPDFLHPSGTGEFNRSHGSPRSLYQ